MLFGAVSPPSSALVPVLPCSGDSNETLCGDGGPATDASLLRPEAVATDQRGGFLIADTANEAIRRVLPDGIITTVAGLGTAGYSGDGGPARVAELNDPVDVSSADDSAVLIADATNNLIRRISPSGTISTVAGTTPASSGRQPSTSPVGATTVALASPQGVAALPDGGFLIADTAANLVLRVDPYGDLTVVAGTGAAEYSGDGGPANSAALNMPTRVTPTPDGGFLVVDFGNQVVRAVSPTGTITTVAGSTTIPNQQFGLLINPGGLALDPGGDIFLVDDLQVERVSNGTATAIAGTGDCNNTGDGGPALSATFAKPAGLALAPGRDILVADPKAGNVRRVDLATGSIDIAAGPTADGSRDPCIAAGGAPTGPLWPIFFITAPRSAHAHRSITVRFATTRGGMVRTSLTRHGHRVRTRLQSARPGSNAVALRGVPRGTYTMSISAHGELPNNNPDEGGTVRLSKRYAARLRVRG